MAELQWPVRGKNEWARDQELVMADTPSVASFTKIEFFSFRLIALILNNSHP